MFSWYSSFRLYSRRATPRRSTKNSHEGREVGGPIPGDARASPGWLGTVFRWCLAKGVVKIELDRILIIFDLLAIHHLDLLLTPTGVAVEKLHPAKFAKTRSRQDAL